MVVAAEPESRIVLSTWAAPLSRQPGQPVTLRAELRDGDEPLAGARVTARLASPAGRASDAIQLTDAGNGIYTATLAELPSADAGAWQVRFDAIVFRGDAALAWAEVPHRVDRGSNDLVIEIPMNLIEKAEGLRVDVRLLGLDQIGVAGRLTLDVQ